MSSAFYGLEIAKSGLFFSQKALNVTGHNISNADTEGYSRQRLHGEAVPLSVVPMRFRNQPEGMCGTGVTVQLLDQVRDIFLDKQIRTENSSSHQWTTKATALTNLGGFFDETLDSSLTKSMDRFFASLDALATNPTDKEMRTSVQQQALGMTGTFNYLYQRMEDTQTRHDNSIDTIASQINDISASIVDYNRQIYVYELQGEKANDLRDQRNVLLDELSGLVNITYEELDNKLTVKIGGDTLLSHRDRYELEVQTSAQVNPLTGVADTNEIVWKTVPAGGTAGSPLNVTSGELKAHIDMVYGDTSDVVGIPYLIEQLDMLASSIMLEMNTLNQAGWTHPDPLVAGSVSEQGKWFFTGGGAKDITLHDDVLNNVFNIAASTEQIDLAADNPKRGNNENALLMAELVSRNDLADIGGFYTFLNSFVTELGITIQQAQNMALSRNTVVTDLFEQRESISGVSLDEEMTQMIRYMHSYSAASRMITTVDEGLDVLINRMGLVGRS